MEVEPIAMEVEKDDESKKNNNDEKKKPRKKREINAWDVKVTKKDFNPEIDAALAKANEFAKDGNLKDAVAALLPLEKATRVAQDAPACTKVVLGITTICFDDPTDGFETAISTVTMLAKRRSALQTPILKMVQKAMDYIEKSPSEERKVALIEALRAVTEGKIFLELESARLTRQLAAIKEKNGDVAEAATIMQETAVETIGSMEAREKTDFILEQIRLCLAKKDYVRADIIGKKIKRDRLIKQGFHDLKLRHCDLMTEFNTHKKNMLALANDFLSRFNTPSVQEYPNLWKPALERVVLYIALAPYGKDQQQLLNRVFKEPKLVEIVDFKWLLKTMLTPEISLEILKKDSLTKHDIFSGKEWNSTETGVERGTDYFKILRRRVMEMNARVVSQYYKRIRLERMSTLLAVEQGELENILSDMVSDNALYCKIDRPMGIVSFVKNQSPEAVLDQWSNDVSTMLTLIDQTCHLIAKENMVNQASGGK